MNYERPFTLLGKQNARSCKFVAMFPLIVHCLHGKHERECLPESSRSKQQVSEENTFRRVYDKTT